MIESRLPPGDPAELYLRISYTDELSGTPDKDALERWEVGVLHGQPDNEAVGGAMVFYRVHLDRGGHAGHAMEDESEDLAEIAEAILDAETGYFTDEVGETLDYVGSALLVMGRVTVDEPWRGFGLGAAQAVEAIHRLMPGCRAVVCSPGISDLSGQRLRERAEWDRVARRIARRWEGLGFRPYRDAVFLLSPASLVLEEQREVPRARTAELSLAWKAEMAGR
ncbi:hypothetical protein HXS80_06350 [Streptomyces sp. CB04723]|uniref:hypothetical protein n=1 Tax=Streptomyces TaxID=1883 RepID=UPI0015C4415D|nr:hypothetical protein [Streptomyces sp. CB04723]QLG31349.1 hypothetical protein HXS80_06350 [Streptomyces sp. CB04723]